MSNKAFEKAINYVEDRIKKYDDNSIHTRHSTTIRATLSEVHSKLLKINKEEE